MMQYADLGDIIEVVFFIAIIAITLIVRALKAASDRARTRRPVVAGTQSKNGWSSAHADQQEWHEWRPEGQSFEVERKVSTPPPLTRSQRESEGFERRRTGWGTPAIESGAIGMSGQDNSDLEKEEDAVQTMQSALAAAFPRSRSMARRGPREASRNIHLRIKGSRDLRRAVLLKEVLGQPRAFDL